jgi:hypothetical protein
MAAETVTNCHFKITPVILKPTLNQAKP